MDVVRRLFGGRSEAPPMHHERSGATLRATVESGETWDDPSEDLLFELMTDIEGGDGTFIIVERLDDATGQTYAESTPTDEGWLVEYRDGSKDRHFGLDVADMRAAHELLTTWAFDLGDWRTEFPWRKVTV